MLLSIHFEPSCYDSVRGRLAEKWELTSSDMICYSFHVSGWFQLVWAKVIINFFLEGKTDVTKNIEMLGRIDAAAENQNAFCGCLPVTLSSMRFSSSQVTSQVPPSSQMTPSWGWRHWKIAGKAKTCLADLLQSSGFMGSTYCLARWRKPLFANGVT